MTIFSAGKHRFKLYAALTVGLAFNPGYALRAQTAPDPNGAADTQEAVKFYKLGVDTANKKDYPNAVSYYTKAIALDGRMQDAYRRRGVAYQNIGNTQEAMADFDQAL